MTNKIIETARAAGGTTYTNRHYPGETACAFGPEALARFYAIAFKDGMERAAEICESIARDDYEMTYLYEYGECADAIRALKEQGTAIAAGKGEA